jgi:hypothetical protein
MSESGGWMDPLETKLCQRQAPEERRGESRGMDRGADVMNKPRLGQLCRTCSPADRIARFEDANGATCAGDFDGRRKAVRT